MLVLSDRRTFVELTLCSGVILCGSLCVIRGLVLVDCGNVVLQTVISICMPIFGNSRMPCSNNIIGLHSRMGYILSSVAGRRQLRSADTRILDVPRTRTAIGARNFAVAGPRVWHSLPPELRTLNCSVGTFVQRLKTFLFSCQRV